MVLALAAHRGGRWKRNDWMPDNNPHTFYEVFLETGIIAQLSRAMLEACTPDGLTQAHFTVLSHLIRVEDGRPPLAIAKAFQVPKNTMTHTLKGLNDRGLIQFSPNPEDSRSKLVYITKEGKKMHERITKALGPEFEQMASEFDLIKLKKALPALRELRVYLDKKRSL